MALDHHPFLDFGCFWVFTFVSFFEFPTFATPLWGSFLQHSLWWQSHFNFWIARAWHESWRLWFFLFLLSMSRSSTSRSSSSLSFTAIVQVCSVCLGSRFSATSLSFARSCFCTCSQWLTYSFNMFTAYFKFVNQLHTAKAWLCQVFDFC